MHFDGALRELNLNSAIVEIQKRDARLARHANRETPDVNFAERIFVDPKIVTGGERSARVCIHPFLRARCLKRYRPLHEIEPRYSAGRVVLRGCLFGGREESTCDEEEHEKER